MKKTDLYNIYLKLDDCKETITKLLSKIQFLKGEEAILFNKICMNYSEYINEYNLEAILDMCLSLKQLCNINNSKIVADEIYDTLSNEDLLENEWFITYIDNITDIIRDKIVFSSFEDSLTIEPDDYTIEIIINLSNLFKYSNEKKELDNDQDYYSIMECYKYVLNDLKYTEANNGENDNYQRLQRIENFVKIVTNSKVMDLSESKYMAVLDVASSINDNKKLLKLNAMLKSDAFLNSHNFKEKIESYTDEYNQNTFLVLQKNESKDYFRKILKKENDKKLYKL